MRSANPIHKRVIFILMKDPTKQSILPGVSKEMAQWRGAIFPAFRKKPAFQKNRYIYIHMKKNDF